MNIKKIFIYFIMVLFLGVIALSVVVVVKRSNEPKDEFVLSESAQPMAYEDFLQEQKESEAESMTTDETGELEDAEADAQDEAQGTPQDDMQEDVQDDVQGDAQENVQDDVQENATKTLYANASVNIRSGPSIRDTRVGSLAVNDEVVAVGEPQDGWQKIMYGDIEAYVSTDYLSESPVGDVVVQP